MEPTSRFHSKEVNSCDWRRKLQANLPWGKGVNMGTGANLTFQDSNIPQTAYAYSCFTAGYQQSWPNSCVHYLCSRNTWFLSMKWFVTSLFQPWLVDTLSMGLNINYWLSHHRGGYRIFFKYVTGPKLKIENFPDFPIWYPFISPISCSKIIRKQWRRFI